MSNRYSKKQYVPAIPFRLSLQVLLGGLEMPALIVIFVCSLASYVCQICGTEADSLSFISGSSTTYSWKIALLFLLMPLSSAGALGYLLMQRWKKLSLLKKGKLLVATLYQVVTFEKHVLSDTPYYRLSFNFITPEGVKCEVHWETNHPPSNWSPYLNNESRNGLSPLLAEVLYNPQHPHSAMLLAEIFPREKSISNITCPLATSPATRG